MNTSAPLVFDACEDAISTPVADVFLVTTVQVTNLGPVADLSVLPNRTLACAREGSSLGSGVNASSISQVFRKGLTRMFEDMGKDTVFMETAVAFRHHPHTYLECIPVPKEIGDMAPMYFKVWTWPLLFSIIT